MGTHRNIDKLKITIQVSSSMQAASAALSNAAQPQNNQYPVREVLRWEKDVNKHGHVYYTGHLKCGHMVHKYRKPPSEYVRHSHACRDCAAEASTKKLLVVGIMEA